MKRKTILNVALMLSVLTLASCDGATEDSPKIQEIDLGQLLAKSNTNTQVKEFKPKLDKLNKYLDSFQFIEDANLYINPKDTSSNHLVLVETKQDLTELNSRDISELTLTQTVLSSLHYKTESSGGKATKKVVIGHILYDTILFNRETETMFLIEGELLDEPLDKELFNSLMIELTLEEFEEIIKDYVVLPNEPKQGEEEKQDGN